MWDLAGSHAVHGNEPSPGARVDLGGRRFLLDARLLLAGDVEQNRLASRGVRLVELYAGRGRVSQVVAERGRRAVRLG